jgi:hypothetical protein
VIVNDRNEVAFCCGLCGIHLWLVVVGFLLFFFYLKDRNFIDIIQRLTYIKPLLEAKTSRERKHPTYKKE